MNAAYVQLSELLKSKFGIILLVYQSVFKNRCFGCSKEPTHWVGSFESPQCMFWLRKITKIIFNYPLIWRSLPRDTAGIYSKPKIKMGPMKGKKFPFSLPFVCRVALIYLMRHLKILMGHLFCVFLFTFLHPEILWYPDTVQFQL